MNPLWVLLCSVPALAQDDLLLRDGFETGLAARWEPAGGDWQVIEDPTDAANHVLRFSGTAGRLAITEPEWRDVRLSARVRISTETSVYHVKLGCHSATANRSCFLNLRDNSPIVVFQDGTAFMQLGSVGDLPFTTGRWFRAEFEASGPFLTAKAWPEDDPGAVVEARFYEPIADRGGIHLTVWMAEGRAEVLFDDVEVVRVPESEPPEAGKTRTIRNDQVQVVFEEATGRFELIDRRTSRRWPQSMSAAVPVISEVTATEERIGYRMQSAAGPVRVSIELKPDAEVLVTLTPDGKGRPAELAYPAPMQPPELSAEIVLPADEGVIIPATDTEHPRLVGRYHYGQSGWLMPWCGIVVGDEGVMMLVETADDFEGRVDRVRARDQVVMAPAVTWLASGDDLRYPRKLRYCLFESGGYVAMAKRYRRYLTDTGRFRALAQKAEEIPNVAKLIGAINILDQSGDQTVLDWMIGNGIRRALYSCGGPRERIEKAKAAGYVVNRYDIYTDVAGPELLEVWGPPRSDTDYRRIGFPEETYIQRDGTPRPGFAYPVGARGGVDPQGREGRRVRCYNRCASQELHWMQEVIPAQIEEFGYAARFIDVETAHSFFECFSDVHPATRSQDRENRLKLFDYLRSIGQICSSEGGGDWAAHALHYQEGSLTLTRLGWLQGIYVGTAPFDVPDEYLRDNFDMSIRVPLHKLVYHDSTFMTWRWNHTPNRWNQPEKWRDWDLLHLLYGGMPIFVVNAESIAEKGDRILESYHTICDFTETVGGQEMVGHRFLTPDRLVQETRFANGRGVIVNFSEDTPFEGEGGVVPPKGFRTVGD